MFGAAAFRRFTVLAESDEFDKGAGRYGTSTDGTPGADCPGEDIFLFIAPYTHYGMRHTFTFNNRITPCENAHHNAGQVFFDGTSYRMIVTRTAIAPDPPDPGGAFSRQFLYTSTNGVTWTNTLFMETPTGGNVEIPEVMLLKSATTANWWGFFRWGPHGSPDQNVGEMMVLTGSQYPNGFHVEILDSTGAWSAVDDTTRTWNFTPMDVWSGVLPHSLINNNGRLELWASEYTNPSGMVNPPCTPTNPIFVANNTPPSTGSTLVWRTVTEAFVLSAPEAFESTVRVAIGDYGLALGYPFRVTDPTGYAMLYSTTMDNVICTLSGVNNFTGMEILSTVIDPY